MIVDGKGKIFEDRRKKEAKKGEIKKDRRKESNVIKKQTKNHK